MSLDTTMYRMSKLGEPNVHEEFGVEVYNSKYSDCQGLVLRNAYNILNIITELEGERFEDERQQYAEAGLEYAYENAIQFIDVEHAKEVLKPILKEIDERTYEMFEYSISHKYGYDYRWREWDVNNEKTKEVAKVVTDTLWSHDLGDDYDDDTYPTSKRMDVIGFMYYVLTTDETKYPFIVVDNWY